MSKNQTAETTHTKTHSNAAKIIAFVVGFVVAHVAAVALCVFLTDNKLSDIIISVLTGQVIFYAAYYSGLSKGRKSA